MRKPSSTPTTFGPAAAVLLSLATGCAVPGDAADPQEVVEADHFVPATPENLNWGWFPIDKAPVLTVQSGETIALVGASGGGKSTIVNLAARFYEPTGGAILVNGDDLRERSLEWY